MSGETRKLPPSSSPSAAVAMMRGSSVIGLEEERDQTRDEAVEEAGLGQREAEPLDAGDLVAHLGLARHGLDDLAEDDADAHAGADGAQASTDAERDRLAGVRGGLGARLGDDGDDGEEQVHRSAP